MQTNTKTATHRKSHASQGQANDPTLFSTFKARYKRASNQRLRRADFTLALADFGSIDLRVDCSAEEMVQRFLDDACPSYRQMDHWWCANQTDLFSAVRKAREGGANPWVMGSPDPRHFWQFASEADRAVLASLTSSEREALMGWNDQPPLKGNL